MAGWIIRGVVPCYTITSITIVNLPASAKQHDAATESERARTWGKQTCACVDQKGAAQDQKGTPSKQRQKGDTNHVCVQTPKHDSSSPGPHSAKGRARLCGGMPVRQRVRPSSCVKRRKHDKQGNQNQQTKKKDSNAVPTSVRKRAPQGANNSQGRNAPRKAPKQADARPKGAGTQKGEKTAARGARAHTHTQRNKNTNNMCRGRGVSSQRQLAWSFSLFSKKRKERKKWEREKENTTTQTTSTAKP